MNTPKQKANLQLLVNQELCPQNHACPSVTICPVGALRQNGFSAPVVTQSQCIKCGQCVKTCPRHALTIEDRLFN